MVIATFHPSPTAPTTFSSGTTASLKKISLNSESPVAWRSGRTSTPGCFMSQMKYVRLWWRCSPPVLATSMHHLARCANEVHTFWPLIVQPPSPCTAEVVSAARSLPAFGSLNPWHHTSSPVRMGPRKRARCSSVPWVMITGPPMTSPRMLAGGGALARTISSLKMACSMSVAPRPPCSRGQEMPT